jgi:hypothetical protein
MASTVIAQRANHWFEAPLLDACPAGSVQSLIPDPQWYDVLGLTSTELVVCTEVSAPAPSEGQGIPFSVWFAVGPPAILLLILMAAVAIRAVHWLRTELTSVAVTCLKRLSDQPSLPPRAVRTAFMKMVPPSLHAQRNHTHGSSARDRSVGSSFATLMGQVIGMDPVFYQQSAADQRLGRSGHRHYYWAKDLAAEYAPLQPGEFHAIIDVDYYMDMNDFLAYQIGPTLLYTFVPTRVAESTGEYSFCFNPDNTIKYCVSGGATYEHALWAYDADVLVARARTWYGWVTEVAYNVDRRQIEKHHQAILLTPIARTSCWMLGMTSFLKSPTLTRLNVVETWQGEQFTRMDVQTPTGRSRSTGKPGCYIEVTIPAVADDGLNLSSSIGKTDITVALVKTSTGIEETGQAALLAQYHRVANPSQPPTVYPVELWNPTFQYYPKTADPDAVSMMEAFMAPLATGGVTPATGVNNELAAVHGRISKVRSPVLPISGLMLAHMDEFSKLLIKHPHTVHPVDEDEVRDRQSRPSQQVILEAASSSGGLSEEKLQTFIKKEPYGKVTEPRVITTIPGRNKLRYSSYSYAFAAEVMRPQPWYAFGKTPKEIAERVADLCSRASQAANTDLSRCDGRISNVFRHFEQLLMMRAFHKSYHTDLLAVMETQHHQDARTTNGVMYTTEDSRLSGSPETADFNSVDNALMAYSAMRRSGLEPEEAWRNLGVYGGDDGLSIDMDTAIYESVATEVGQVLEIEQIARNKRGVTFLSRYYSPYVWTGSPDSMADVKRQVLKLHLTVRLPPNVTAFAKLLEKCRSYALSDARTPVLGELAEAVFELALRRKELDSPTVHALQPFNARYAPSEQYPNEDEQGWMGDELRETFPQFDLLNFRMWLRDVVAPGGPSVLRPPVFADLPISVPKDADVVVIDDVVGSPKAGTPACRDFIAGKCKFGKKCKFTHGEAPAGAVA